LVVPKVSRADDIRTLEAALTGTLQGVPIIPIIETAKAMVEGEAIAATSIGVSAIIFGAIDYSTDVGCATEWDALLYARSRVVLAASAADIDAVDGPFMEVERLDFLKAECRDVARLGFAGKVAIHPTQVDIIHECFTPTPETVARALRVIAAYEAGGSGPLLVDGTLIERPVIERAKRTLHIAQLSKKAGQPG
jgi:citrate lyase beta subunit